MKKPFLLLLLLAFAATTAQAERDTLRLYFEAGQSEVSGFQLSLIDIFLSTHYGSGAIVVSGHADGEGDYLTNLDNSRNRALSVAQYAAEKGVPACRLMVEAWGETRPACTNATRAGRARNRRVELVGIPEHEVAQSVFAQAQENILLNATDAIPYREMTTADGLPRRRYVINTLDQVQSLCLDQDQWRQSFSMNPGRQPICGFREPDCQPLRRMDFKVPTKADVRCPLEAIHFNHPGYDTAKTAVAEPIYLKPQKEAGEYYFHLTIPQLRNCQDPVYTIAAGCLELQTSKVEFSGIRQVHLNAFVPRLNEKVGVKHVANQFAHVKHLAGDPGSVNISGTFQWRKRKVYTLTDMPLSQLPWDAATKCYRLTRKDLRAIAVRHKQ